ncbi:MAG: AAA family ATPase [Planctomycetia bacterium]|nr:AAA family ATPase [Planctomycetia bacterium]
MAPGDLKLLIEAGHPLISIESRDEPRALRVVRGVAASLSIPVATWSLTEGLVEKSAETSTRVIEARSPSEALRVVQATGHPTVFVFRDLGVHCRDAQVVRQLRDLFFTPPGRMWTLVLVDAAGLPPDVRRLTVPFDVGAPDARELEDIVRETFTAARSRSLSGISARLTTREMDQIVHLLRGLTGDEAARVVNSAIHDDGVLDGADLPRIMAAKRNLLEASGSLEAIVADVAPDDVGGLANLKAWLARRRGGFSQKARDYGLDPPRGMLLLGVQGCGKSLCAKVVSAAWNMPLLRMDPGAFYEKFVGESEARLREALAQAEAMAPVVLWIDEIEKAFASAAGATADGGLSQRMFGTLLSWMQDHRHPIFLVATANDIARLPPELMRKGRFDEIFFVDLPGIAEREAVFSIHLRRRRRAPEAFDVGKLAAAAEGLTGAEIEQAVVSGLYAAFHAATECTTDHVLEALRTTQPLSVVMRERIEALRDWARERCVPAD